jgi:hypothetical protein
MEKEAREGTFLKKDDFTVVSSQNLIYNTSEKLIIWLPKRANPVCDKRFFALT